MSNFIPLRTSLRLVIVICMTSASVLWLPAFAGEVERSKATLIPFLIGVPGESISLQTLVPLEKRSESNGSSDTSPLRFRIVGDLVVGFVFFDGKSEVNALSSDLDHLELSPKSALQAGIANFRRMCGAIQTTEFTNGIVALENENLCPSTTLLLDSEMWQELAKSYPNGLAVGVPVRGQLLLVPLSNRDGVRLLREIVAEEASAFGTRPLSIELFALTREGWRVLPP